MIELNDIKKTFTMGKNQYHALKGITCKISTGEMVALVGTSGSGKTTTMNIIGLLMHPSSGTYFLDNMDVSKLKPDQQAELRNRYIGFVFQQFHLLSRINALDNVSLPLIYRGLDKKTIKRRAMSMLRQVEMDTFWRHKPNELSGGQRQRVAIARALIGGPQIILADEPTGALDSKTGEHVLQILMKLHKQKAATVIIVTHDHDLAKRCPRVIEIHDGLLTKSTI